MGFFNPSRILLCTSSKFVTPYPKPPKTLLQINRLSLDKLQRASEGQVVEEPYTLAELGLAKGHLARFGSTRDKLFPKIRVK